VLVEVAPDRIAEHVVAQHLREVVEATRPDHAVVEVGSRLVVPVVQPASVELVEDLLLGLFELGIVVLSQSASAFCPCFRSSSR
jgi:hypothetical protein